MTVKVVDGRAFIYLRGEYLLDVDEACVNEVIYTLIDALGL